MEKKLSVLAIQPRTAAKCLRPHTAWEPKEVICCACSGDEVAYINEQELGGPVPSYSGELPAPLGATFTTMGTIIDLPLGGQVVLGPINLNY
jgi:hypothetical protein